MNLGSAAVGWTELHVLRLAGWLGARYLPNVTIRLL